MPLLAALLGSAFTKLVEIFGGFFTRKIAISIAWASFVIAGWGALQVLLFGLWTGLGYVMPPSLEAPFKTALYLMPSNADDALGAIIAGRIARWVLDRQYEWSKIVATV